MTSIVSDAEPHFNTERFDTDEGMSAQVIREAEYGLFGPYAQDGTLIDDMDLEVARLQGLTGMGSRSIKNAILAYSRLRDLPMLRSIQEEKKLLDVARLATIDRALDELGNNTDYSAIAQIDLFLAEYFTPSKPNQPLPQTGSIRYQLQRAIAALDPSLDYDPKRRERREEKMKTALDRATVRFTNRGSKAVMELEADAATIAAAQAAIEEVAREKKESLGDSALRLLTGDATPSAKLVLYGFTPKDSCGGAAEGEQVYFPGIGWTDTSGLATLEEMGGRDAARFVDLDAAAEHTIGGYVPSDAMKAFCIARDGTCIWPGCSRRAENCQFDHRIPFEEGGATSPTNLYSLCQHHHNVKTDRRAFYVPDPDTGEIVWLFEDGTYLLEDPEGFLGDHLVPRNPEWKQTLADVQSDRRHAAEFYAKAHAVADRLDAGEDEAQCLKDIKELEEEYGIRFPFQLETPPF